MDLDYYFKEDLIERYGEDGYQLFVDLIIGE